MGFCINKHGNIIWFRIEWIWESSQEIPSDTISLCKSWRIQNELVFSLHRIRWKSGWKGCIMFCDFLHLIKYNLFFSIILKKISFFKIELRVYITQMFIVYKLLLLTFCWIILILKQTLMLFLWNICWSWHFPQFL